MAKNYLEAPHAAVRRTDRAVDDNAWIVDFLRRAPMAQLATVHDGQPFINSNLFAYDEAAHVVYMHSAPVGRTRSNVEADERACLSVSEMGRLLPSHEALTMSVEYDGVAIFGGAHVLSEEVEREHGLRLILDKYFPHLAYGADYRAITPDELTRTTVYRIDIDAWSGKRKRVDDEFVGAFRYGAHPSQRGEQSMTNKAHASADGQIETMGLMMPPYRPPAGTFVHAARTGNLLMLSGHAPIRADGSVIVGRLGETLDIDAGYEAARVAALGALATLRHELGSLDRVARIVKVFGVVNATADFLQHTQVINGASDLLVQVFGEAGKHVRLAVGVSSLPFNIALEIELVAEVAD
jgi:hypothetical protein